MNDLVYRQDAIDAAIDAADEWDGGCSPSRADMIEKAISKLPPVQSDDWIPCSNTVDIPEYEVLCCDRRGNELIGWLFYNNGQWFCESEGETMYGTIAWREKPEPYKEECKE